MMICSSNKNTCTCEHGESIFINTLKEIIIKQLNLLNDNRSAFKTSLISAFRKDKESNSKERLEALESEILALRKHYENLSSSHSDYHEAIKDELIQEITELTNQKVLLQNQILTMETAEDKAGEIINQLKKIPENLESLDNIDFKSILKNVIVINRNELVFLVGSEDINHLPNKLQPLFETNCEYKIRKTRFICRAGIYINS